MNIYHITFKVKSDEHQPIKNLMSVIYSEHKGLYNVTETLRDDLYILSGRVSDLMRHDARDFIALLFDVDGIDIQYTNMELAPPYDED